MGAKQPFILEQVLVVRSTMGGMEHRLRISYPAVGASHAACDSIEKSAGSCLQFWSYATGSYTLHDHVDPKAGVFA